MTTKHPHIYKAMRTLFSIAALLLICGCSEQGNDQEKLLDDTVCLIEQYPEQMQRDTVQDIIRRCKKGDPEAEWKIGNLMVAIWTYKEPNEEVRELVNKWLRKAAKDGSEYAMLDLAVNINGLIELTEQQRLIYAKNGIHIIENKTEKSDLDATYLSQCYAEGVGVEKNIEEAYKWFVTSLDLKNVPESKKKILIERWRKSYLPENLSH